MKYEITIRDKYLKHMTPAGLIDEGDELIVMEQIARLLRGMKQNLHGSIRITRVD